MKVKKIVKTFLLNSLTKQQAYSFFSYVRQAKTSVMRGIRFIYNGFKDSQIKFPMRQFGDDKYQVFFGYYDVSPVNYDDTILLAMRAPLPNVLPKADTVLEVGYYGIHDKKSFIPVGETSTWCWQQGCRLQWYPLKDNGRSGTILYNTLVEGHYGSIIQDIKSGSIIRIFNRPIYSVSSDGRWGLSLNFSRLHRMRRGYGYVNFPDDTQQQLAPNNDGILRINMESGEEKLLVSLEDIAFFEPTESIPMKGAEHYFNHLLFNDSGSRFLFFHVWLHGRRRFTRLITCNINGKDCHALANEGHVSHYNWKNDYEVLCYSTHSDEGTHYYLYNDKTFTRTAIGNSFLNQDGHPSYSPTKKYLLTDTYPDKYNDRHLLIFEFASEKLHNIGRFFNPFKYVEDLRCDLHPRWSPSGKYIAFDSAHKGTRAIYLLDWYN